MATAVRSAPVAARTLYRDMSSREILEKLLLLKLCGSEAFVQRAHKLHSASASLLGERVTASLMKHVMVKHFVAGESYPALKTVGERMAKFGVRIMFIPPMEDVEEHFSEATLKNCQDNKHKYLHDQQVLVRLNQDLGTQNIMQFKLSAVIPSIAMNALSTSLNLKRVPLAEAGGMIGDYYARGNQSILGLIDDSAVRKAMLLGLDLSREIFEVSCQNRVPLLVDAELMSAHTAMYAVYLGAATMECQKDSDLWVTYQCYMKDMHSKIEQTMAACKALGVRFGAKVVRGAYLQLERDIAADAGQDDPTWETAELTSKCYDQAIAMILQAIAEPGNGHAPILCVASHNQDSVDKAKAKMGELGLQKSDPRICFGQIFGMCDHISYDLGRSGYNIFKSTPYGPAGSWAPYLSRRAAENHTAILTARNEAPFYWRELKQRCRLRKAHVQ